jgi:pimeloyl-ACP methyl ester carboxylesterase
MRAEPNQSSTAAPGSQHTVLTRLGPLAVRRHEGSGPWLVLWHSLFLDGRSWDRVLPALTRLRSVLVIDGPCHGDSPGPMRRFSLDECADAALEVLDHFGVSCTDWIGNAWGGHVGAVLAARHPSRITRLVAISSPMQALRPAERLRLGLLATIFRIVGWRHWLVRAVVDALVLPSAPADVKRYVADAAQAPGAARTQLAMRSVMFGRPSLVERLASIEAPTLFITTADDTLWPPSLARAHADRLQRGRLELVEGARHIPPLEAPDTIAELLVDWLTTGESRTR